MDARLEEMVDWLVHNHDDTDDTHDTHDTHDT
jgi:hypothetical protein